MRRLHRLINLVPSESALYQPVNPLAPRAALAIIAVSILELQDLFEGTRSTRIRPLLRSAGEYAYRNSVLPLWNLEPYDERWVEEQR